MRPDQQAGNDTPKPHTPTYAVVSHRRAGRDPYKTLIATTCVVVLGLLAWEILVTVVFESRMAGLIEKERSGDRIKEQVDNYARSLHPVFRRDDRFRSRSEDEIERDIRAKGVPGSVFR